MTTEGNGREFEMRTVYIPEKIIPAMEFGVYDYSELSEEAKEAAFLEFATEKTLLHYLELAREDIYGALNDFCDKIHASYICDGYGLILITPGRSRGYDDISYVKVEDTGLCYSIDICELWNAHVEALAALYDAYAEDPYCDAAEAAYKELGTAVRFVFRMIELCVERADEAEADYYYYDPRQFFEDFDAYEHEYTEDGVIYDAA